MHVAFLSIGGVLDDIFFVCDIILCVLETSYSCCECFDVLFSLNRICYTRCRGVALLD